MDKIETYIICHDQNIITDYEKANKFSNITNYKYVFVGNGDCDKIENNDKVIIARNLPINLEQHPNLTAFTGWYALCKNNLLKSDIINLFEYDIIIHKSPMEKIDDFFTSKNVQVLGYNPVPMTRFFIGNPAWIGDIFTGIQAVHGIDMEQMINDRIKVNPNDLWLATSNLTISKKLIADYIDWFEPLIPYIIANKNAGHIFERSITFFCLMSNTPYSFIQNHISHFQLDSHKSQGYSVDTEHMVGRLIKNK